jgi:hypothetical protein
VEGQSYPRSPCRNQYLEAWMVNSKLLETAGEPDEVSHYRGPRYETGSN